MNTTQETKVAVCWDTACAAEENYRVMAVGCPRLIPGTWTGFREAKLWPESNHGRTEAASNLPGSGIAQPLARAVLPK